MSAPVFRATRPVLADGFNARGERQWKVGTTTYTIDGIVTPRAQWETLVSIEVKRLQGEADRAGPNSAEEGQRHYDLARARYTDAVHPILLDPSLSKFATLTALIDCVACIAAGGVESGGLPQHEIVARFTQSLAEAVQVASERHGAH